MTSILRSLLALILVTAVAGCAGPIGPIDPEDSGGTDDTDNGGDDGDDDSLSDFSIFAPPNWSLGGRFSPSGTPPFDIPGKGSWQPVDVAVGSSNPAYAPVVPRRSDDIDFLGRAAYRLYSGQIDAITETFNSGLPTKNGDLMLIPSLAMFTPPDEPYFLFQIKTVDDIDDEELGRTRVVGIAFGNDTGGYVPSPPYTNDTFAGALVWMKATQNPTYGTWSMDQRDWRNGVGNVYATSMRILMRDNSAVAIIKEAELQALGATWFRWDTYSYGANVDTDWSHDFTERTLIPF